MWHGDIVWCHGIKGGATDEAFQEQGFLRLLFNFQDLLHAWEHIYCNTEGKDKIEKRNSSPLRIWALLSNSLMFFFFFFKHLRFLKSTLSGFIHTISIVKVIYVESEYIPELWWFLRSCSRWLFWWITVIKCTDPIVCSGSSSSFLPCCDALLQF